MLNKAPSTGLATNPKDGCRIHYRVVGDGLRPLVMLAGFYNSPELGSLPETLSALGYRCIPIDQRGTGKSGSPKKPWSVGTAASDVVAVMDHLALRRSDFLGYSYGGMVAQKLALTSPHRIATLVLMETAGGLPFRLPTRRGLRQLLSPPATPADGAVNADLLRGTIALLSHVRSRKLRRLDVPTLIVHGTHDEVLPVRNARSLRARIPRAQLHLIPGGTHGIPDDPARVATEIVSFITG